MLSEEDFNKFSEKLSQAIDDVIKNDQLDSKLKSTVIFKSQDIESRYYRDRKNTLIHCPLEYPIGDSSTPYQEILDSVSATGDAVKDFIDNIGHKIDQIILAIAGTNGHIIERHGPVQPKPNIKNFESKLTVSDIELLKKEFDEKGVSSENRYLIIKQDGISQLLSSAPKNEKEVVELLICGKLDEYKGFRFIRTERIPDNEGFAWQQESIILAFGEGKRAQQVYVIKDPSRSYGIFAQANIYIGAMRLSEEGVCKFTYGKGFFGIECSHF